MVGWRGSWAGRAARVELTLAGGVRRAMRVTLDVLRILPDEFAAHETAAATAAAPVGGCAVAAHRAARTCAAARRAAACAAASTDWCAAARRAAATHSAAAHSAGIAVGLASIARASRAGFALHCFTGDATGRVELNVATTNVTFSPAARQCTARPRVPAKQRLCACQRVTGAGSKLRAAGSEQPDTEHRTATHVTIHHPCSHRSDLAFPRKLSETVTQTQRGWRSSGNPKKSAAADSRPAIRDRARRRSETSTNGRRATAPRRDKASARWHRARKIGPIRLCTKRSAHGRR